MDAILSLLFLLMPPCEYEDSTNCQFQGQFVALHAPGTSTDTLIFKDGRVETMPTNYDD